MRKPKALYKGAKVALLSTSGRISTERLEPAIESVKALGLIPVVYESCTKEHGYFAGNDMLRARDLNLAFLDTDIDGILCMRGGYGANRILPLLDYNMILRNPKVFSGYSDVTALHIVFNEICGFETYHTPMPATELFKGVDDYTLGYYKRLLFGDILNEYKNPEGNPLQAVVNGYAEGELVGGNLSLVVSSLGTPYEINTRNKILFLEDVNEEIYQIDSKLTQLRNAGKLTQAAGIILGEFTSKEEKDKDQNRINGIEKIKNTDIYALTLRQVIDEVIVPENKPTVINMQCGHILPTLSLPLGRFLQLSSQKTTRGSLVKIGRWEIK